MRPLLILFACLLTMAVFAFAGSLQSDEEYTNKQWSNTLLLEGKSATIVSMLMSLPSEPVSVDSKGEPVIHDAYFHRENDKGGNPNLGVLIQVSEAQLMTYSVIYNANKGKKK